MTAVRWRRERPLATTKATAAAWAAAMMRVGARMAVRFRAQRRALTPAGGRRPASGAGSEIGRAEGAGARGLGDPTSARSLRRAPARAPAVRTPSTRSTGATPRTLLVSRTPSSGRRSATRAHASTTGMPAAVAAARLGAEHAGEDVALGRRRDEAAGAHDEHVGRRALEDAALAVHKQRVVHAGGWAARWAKVDCITVIALY